MQVPFTKGRNHTTSNKNKTRHGKIVYQNNSVLGRWNLNYFIDRLERLELQGLYWSLQGLHQRQKKMLSHCSKNRKNNRGRKKRRRQKRGCACQQIGCAARGHKAATLTTAATANTKTTALYFFAARSCPPRQQQ